MSDISSEPADVYDRGAEVAALLAADDTTLGRYWSYVQERLTREQMAEREGTRTTGWTSNYGYLMDNLLTGRTPGTVGDARQTASRLRTWLRQKPLSPQLRVDFQREEKFAREFAENREQQAAEVESAVERTVRAESTGGPGIYVYTLPHYVRHPYEPKSGRTLLKVGHSAVDVIYRSESQARITALPEEPILLRIYPAEKSANVERQFHAWLRDADHVGGRSGRMGAEWFLTSPKFLDRIATSMGLDVVEVNAFEVGDE